MYWLFVTEISFYMVEQYSNPCYGGHVAHLAVEIVTWMLRCPFCHQPNKICSGSSRSEHKMLVRCSTIRLISTQYLGDWCMTSLAFCLKSLGVPTYDYYPKYAFQVFSLFLFPGSSNLDLGNSGNQESRAIKRESRAISRSRIIQANSGIPNSPILPLSRSLRDIAEIPRVCCLV